MQASRAIALNKLTGFECTPCTPETSMGAQPSGLVGATQFAKTVGQGQTVIAKHACA